jgi:hypothetical protein
MAGKMKAKKARGVGADAADRRDGRKGPRPAMAAGPDRVIGGRRYKRYEGEVIHAIDGRWMLVMVPEWSKDGWTSFKLFYDYKPAKKRIWHLAVKDGRVTGGIFITHLERNHPDALYWAKKMMKEHK